MEQSSFSTLEAVSSIYKLFIPQFVQVKKDLVNLLNGKLLKRLLHLSDVYQSKNNQDKSLLLEKVCLIPSKFIYWISQTSLSKEVNCNFLSKHVLKLRNL